MFFKISHESGIFSFALIFSQCITEWSKVPLSYCAHYSFNCQPQLGWAISSAVKRLIWWMYPVLGAPLCALREDYSRSQRHLCLLTEVSGCHTGGVTWKPTFPPPSAHLFPTHSKFLLFELSLQSNYSPTSHYGRNIFLSGFLFPLGLKKKLILDLFEKNWEKYFFIEHFLFGLSGWEILLVIGT